MSILRDITKEIEKYIKKDEILLLIGARQSGKTTILHQLKDIIEMQNDRQYFINLEDPDYLSLLKQSPKNLFKLFSIDLNKKNFVLIDEIQYLENPSNFLKYFYDEYKGRIKIIASGSSAFYIDKKFKDSLAGRKKIFYVLTLSFREFLRFKNETELSGKSFDHLSISEKGKIVLYYQEYMVYGGYPKAVFAPIEEKEEVLSDIAYSYIKKDIYDANIHNDEIFYKLFKLLSYRTGNLVNTNEISSSLGVSRTSINNYLYIMQKSFHIHLLKPFSKNIKKELVKMPKVYFLDSGLRNFFAKDFKTYFERNDKGSLLENGVYRELLNYYDFEDIRFWRSAQGSEIDFIVNENKAIEVKVNPKDFNPKRFKDVLENYTDLKFSVASFDSKIDKTGEYNVYNLWELNNI